MLLNMQGLDVASQSCSTSVDVAPCLQMNILALECCSQGVKQCHGAGYKVPRSFSPTCCHGESRTAGVHICVCVCVCVARTG